jgi:hypothetical protein
VTFTIKPVNKNGSVSFYLGMDMPVQGDNSGAAVGAASANFGVSVVGTGLTTSTAGGTATANVMKSLTIGVISDLSFGTVIRPTAGSGVVDVSADNGGYALNGLVALPNSNPPSAANFALTGQPSQTVSITFSPSQLTLKGSPNGGTLTVALSQNRSSGTLDSNGAFSFGIGGSIYIVPTSPYGTYSGIVTVTAAYN